MVTYEIHEQCQTSSASFQSHCYSLIFGFSNFHTTLVQAWALKPGWYSYCKAYTGSYSDEVYFVNLLCVTNIKYYGYCPHRQVRRD